MHKGRLEAFSDGVIAIIITIMVLEIKVPHGDGAATWPALQKLVPVFLSYVLSFAYVGIYWNNHHHLLQSAHRTNGAILWANLHLLFWLSLMPFTSGWMGENHFTQAPTMLYGVVLLMSAIAYYILQQCIVAEHGTEHSLARALGRDVKGKLSIALNLAAILTCFWKPFIAHMIYIVVALIWLVPDRRIERALAESNR
jgi:uncharacterized membrane protein